MRLVLLGVLFAGAASAAEPPARAEATLNQPVPVHELSVPAAEWERAGAEVQAFRHGTEEWGGGYRFQQENVYDEKGNLRVAKDTFETAAEKFMKGLEAYRKRMIDKGHRVGKGPILVSHVDVVGDEAALKALEKHPLIKSVNIYGAPAPEQQGVDPGPWPDLLNINGVKK